MHEREKTLSLQLYAMQSSGWQPLDGRLGFFVGFFWIISRVGTNIPYSHQHMHLHGQLTYRQNLQTESNQNKHWTTLLTIAPGNPISHHDTRHDWAGSGECCLTHWARTDTIFTDVNCWVSTELPWPVSTKGAHHINRRVILLASPRPLPSPSPTCILQHACVHAALWLFSILYQASPLYQQLIRHNASQHILTARPA